MPTRPSTSQDALARAHAFERSLDAHDRRSLGAHSTPVEVSAPVLELALDALGRTPGSVCDPSCGAGAFLIAAAEALVARGVPAHEVVTERLCGMDLDPSAVTTARRLLSQWASQHGATVDPSRVQVHRGDALAIEPPRWPGRPARGFDLVLGNPPFLGQLSADTSRDAARRRRLGERFGGFGAYTDDAALFLAAGIDLVAPGGVVALVQPQSILSARDAASVRDRATSACDLVALWAHGGSPFPDAEVAVCAPVLRRHDGRAAPDHGPHTCEVHWDQDGDTHLSSSPSPSPGQRWGALLAPAMGVPEVPRRTGATVGTVANATAGFRDEFYALADCLIPASEGQRVDRGRRDRPRLLSVGMIDPLCSRWDQGEHRIAGRRVRSPRVDLELLGRRHPRVGRWATARLVPKVLLATQTKVVEAVADPAGDCLPLTPVISVEPRPGAVDVWHLAAALSAPPVAAAALREHAGSGRSSGVLRWSARSASEALLPVDPASWAQGAQLARRLQELPAGHDRATLLDELAVVMTEAHGLSGDHPVVSWWSMRRPRR